MIDTHKKEVYIIGGGASGAICAIEASKKYRVHIIEKNDKLMKKLLITGNGSCNFSNKALKDKDKYKDRYNNDFILNVYDSFTYDDLLRYMSDIGIYSLSKTKYDEEYIYPYDYNSKSVYYNLMDALKERNVDIIYNEEVTDIKIDNDKYIIITKDKRYNADIAVISTGGKSYQKTGSDGKMLYILKDMGINIIDPIPSLCPLYHHDSGLKDLKGIRTECEVSVKIEGDIRYKECGEIQFNDSSLSGIPILNISCKVGRDIYNHKNVSISIDFIKDISDVSFFKKRQKDLSYKYIRDFLCGIVDNKISYIIYKKLNIKNIDDDKVSTLKDKDIDNIYYSLKHFDINIDELAGFDVAQVTKGGVDIKEINNTFMSKKYKDMYVIGEALDVDGICGGYNLSFAFISGILAGKNITSL